MPRFQVDDKFHGDPAVVRAGTAAFGLYIRCGTYVAEHLLDGHVPTEIAAQYGTPEWIKKLTDVRLWEIEPGGQSYNMPLYFEHGNLTRERVLADRKAKSERQQRWLEKSRKSSSGQRRVSRPSTRQSADPSRVTSADLPLPPSLTGRKGAHARATARGAGGAPQPPLLLPVEQHPFKPDSNGTTCESCGFPETNRHHQEAS